MPDTEKLNPVIKTTTIGVRVFREISIYPLSVNEQLKLTDLITDALKKFFEAGEGELSADNIKFVSFVVDLIKDNVSQLIELVTEEETDILDDMTNEQLIDFAEVIYDMNFGGARKKLESFVRKIKSPQETE